MKSNDGMTNFALLMLRLTAGLILLYFGSQKFLGAFGGMGLTNTIVAFKNSMGIPTPMTVLAVIAEFFGGLGLVLGVFTRVAAFGVLCTMAVATYTNVQKIESLVATQTNPFPINGAAFPMALGAIALALMLLGSGDWSLEAHFFAKRRRR
ncbi:MAG: DoxX family protein [Chthonomonas sp.]|nr:DoxX family protein [Chthonomonas sp.]